MEAAPQRDDQLNTLQDQNTPRSIDIHQVTLRASEALIQTTEFIKQRAEHQQSLALCKATDHPMHRRANPTAGIDVLSI